MAMFVNLENIKNTLLFGARLYTLGYGINALKDSHTIATKVATVLRKQIPGEEWFRNTVVTPAKEVIANLFTQEESAGPSDSQTPSSSGSKPKIQWNAPEDKRTWKPLAYSLGKNTMICAIGLSLLSYIAAPHQAYNTGLSYLLSPFRIECSKTPFEVITNLVNSYRGL